jgi:hypothetical protein
MKQGLSDVLLFVITLRLVLRVFFNSPTQFLPMKAGIGDVLLLCDSFLLFGLRVVKAVLPSSYL